MKKTAANIFFDEDGALQLPIKVQGESVWLNQKQMGLLFDRDYKTIAKHIANVFGEGELERKVVVANFATTTRHGAMEGNWKKRQLLHCLRQFNWRALRTPLGTVLLTFARTSTIENYAKP